MASDLLVPRMPGQGVRIRAAQDAKNMEQLINDRCMRKGLDPPDYEFLELIGKGTYGRVYKCRDRRAQLICAIKIIEVDQTDYRADTDAKDDTLKEFIRETSILQSLKNNNVKNVNRIFDAFSVDSWLWIVTEYCPGGSLATLMKANNRASFPGLEEEYIIPIAREVSVALKSVHEAGIIHRDIKCANILVTEDGRLQLCDFGISNVLENEVSKRSTIIGTPHWMAPELVAHLGSDFESVRYGTEIDCWAFGCAVYEMATGLPPNARIQPGDLGMALHREAPKLEGNKYSKELKEFVAFILEGKPEDRPSAAQIVEHKLIRDTDVTYPTDSVRKLIEYFANWESSGGQRNSLFNAYGATGAGDSSTISPTSEGNSDWNFSTTSEFDRRMSMGLDPFDNKTAYEKRVEEARIQRGGHAMRGIFDMSEPQYGLNDPNHSDLRFRNLSNPPHTAADRMTLIDIDNVIPSFEEAPNLDLDSVPTIRARKYLNNDDEDGPPHGDTSVKRETKEWTFPQMAGPDENIKNANRQTRDWKFPSMLSETVEEEEASQTTRKINREEKSDYRSTREWTFPAQWPSAQEQEAVAPQKPALPHSKTAPVAFSYTSSVASSPDRSSMIDLDSALHIQISEISRPQTADSTAESAGTETTSGDPFEYDFSQESKRGSMHMKSQSEPSANFPNSQSVDESNYLAPDTSHNRSSSVTSGTDLNRNSSNGYPKWHGNLGVSRAQVYDEQSPWDPFSDEDESVNTLAPPWAGPNAAQSALRRGRGRQGRSHLSTSSGLTNTSDDSSPGGNVGATLRPSHLASKSKGSRTIVRPPRDPNKAALMGSDRRMMEEELALMYDELGAQADMMVGLLAGLVMEEEGMDDLRVSGLTNLSSSMTLTGED
jgi:protein-serine/threonine kinase